jgi:hypothetical protein
VRWTSSGCIVCYCWCETPRIAAQAPLCCRCCVARVGATALTYSCAAVAVVHVLQALVYIYLAKNNIYFTWPSKANKEGVFVSLRFVMSHCIVLRRSMTSVGSGKVLLLCLVPVIGWGVWCCSKKATRSHTAEVSLHDLQVCEKMRSRTASRAVLPLSSYSVNVSF